MKNNLIFAPIDNKNLMEDAFEDDVFGSFLAARDHRKGGVRHLVGMECMCDCNVMLDVYWCYGGHSVAITVIGVSPTEDFDMLRDEAFEHYRDIFKSWECDDNPNLCVRTSTLHDTLNVRFYFDMTEELSLREKYDMFMDEHGHFPKYMSCSIVWEDSGERCDDYIIKLDEMLDEKDNEIFFYASGINDVVKMLEHGYEDFVVVEDTVEFMDEI